MLHRAEPFLQMRAKAEFGQILHTNSSCRVPTEKYLIHPHVYVGMATKNISITEEAYRRLASLKHEHESFSVVINRLTGKHSLAKLFGVLSRDEASHLDENLARSRKERARADRDRKRKLEEVFS